jgi:enterochelin esterase-like enzyme
MSGARARSLLGFLLLLALSALGCAQVQGRFKYVSLASQREGGTRNYSLYLPKGWDGKTPLPLVVLLHGAGDDESSPDRFEVVQQLDQALENKQLPPFVLVAPEGDRGFWVNWYDGSHHYRDWVIDEVLPSVRASYPILPGPAGLHLLGVSMGGGGGMQMWLQDPAAFASAALLSAPILDQQGTRKFLHAFLPDSLIARVFGPEGAGHGKDPYAVLTRADDLHGSRLLFGAATHDRQPILPSNQTFDAALTARAIPHTFVTFPGKHGWRAWAAVFPYALCKQLLDAACTLAPPR